MQSKSASRFFRSVSSEVGAGCRDAGVDLDDVACQCCTRRLVDGNSPFLVGLRSRRHAAMASRCFGVIRPTAMFGRS
jgi:hypothetical protein